MSDTPSTPRKFTLSLTGYVGEGAFAADYIEYILTREAESEVTVLISSFGGSANDGLRIAAAFRRHGNVTVHYSGMNASAATISGMGAKRIVMESSAFWMIHDSSIWVDVFGTVNAEGISKLIEELNKSAELLQTLDKGIAALYAERCKKDPKELSKLMDCERWMTAAEALEWGFADEVVPTAAKAVPEAVVAALADAGLPTPPGSQPQSLAARIRAGIASFFEECFPKRNTTDNSKISQDMAQEQNTAAQDEQQPTAAAEQAVESAESNATAETTEAPAQNADQPDDVKAMKEENAQLKAQLAEMSAKPGDTTKAVVESRKEKRADDNAVSAYVSDLAMAQKLYDALP